MSLPDVPELSDAEKLALEKKALGFYMSSHPLARHAGELQALATHRVADLPGVPEKTEVVLGGMISGISSKNVQKSRSGLTRMAKLTFEDLSGSTPAMLWPEEFAKMEALVKNDQIVFVRGTLNRSRDPRRAGRQPDHPAGAGAGRADPRRRRAAAQGCAPGRAPRAAAPRRSASGPATSTCISRSWDWSRSAARSTKAGPSLAGALRRSALARPGERRGRRPRPPARPPGGHHADRWRLLRRRRPVATRSGSHSPPHPAGPGTRAGRLTRRPRRRLRVREEIDSGGRIPDSGWIESAMAWSIPTSGIRTPESATPILSHTPSDPAAAGRAEVPFRRITRDIHENFTPSPGAVSRLTMQSGAGDVLLDVRANAGVPADGISIPPRLAPSSPS